MVPFFDFSARIALVLLVVLAFVALRVWKRERLEPLVYGLAGLAGAAAFFNFGGSHQLWSTGFVNRSDIHHAQLGSKYFPELGYDGLYFASLLAQEETAPQIPVRRKMRDLETMELVWPADSASKVAAVRGRFSDERWQSFATDQHDYIANTPARLWGKIRLDHGYNPTPAWTFVARLFTARLPATEATLVALGAIDLVLVIVMFTLLFRTYGYRVACLSLAVFGLGYGWRYLYIGSFLRLDWLATVVIGTCLLKRERFVAGGAFLGYATVVRLFPALFLVGPALLMLRSWLRGERPGWSLQLAAGFGAVVCLGLALGSATGRGVEAWKEFGDHIQVYRSTWSADLIGLDTLFLSGPDFLLVGERRTVPGVKEDLAQRRVARVAVAVALLVLLGVAMWRATLAESVVLGVVAIFALTPAPAYYWIMALLIPLRRGRAAALALLLLSAALHALHMVYPYSDEAAWRFGLLAWGYALILISWLVPDLVAVVRGRREPQLG